jgi:hypothetical protein
MSLQLVVSSTQLTAEKHTIAKKILVYLILSKGVMIHSWFAKRFV